MAVPVFLSDGGGTLLNKWRIGYRTAAAYLKYVSGGFVIRNAADAADAPLTASVLNASGDDIVWNSDAAGSGDDWVMTLSRAPTGMTADVQLFLPIDNGSNGQALFVDNAGQLYFDTIPGGVTNMTQTDDTALVFGSTGTLALFTKPDDTKIPCIRVLVTTAFNGTNPTVSIGIAGTLSKYSGTDDIDLTTEGLYIIYPDVPVETGGSEALIATYVPDSSSAGAATISIDYVAPL